MNCVINPTRCSEAQILASSKLAMWISSLLRIKLIDTKQLATQALQSKIETLFIVNGMFGFCDFRDEIRLLGAKAKEIVWIGNDYTCIIPKQLNIRQRSNIRRIAIYDNFDNFPRHTVVDMNKLLHFDGAKRTPKYNGLFYYGSFRDGRVGVFKKWLNHDMFDVHISTAQKNVAEYAAIAPVAKMYKAQGDIKKFIHFFQSSLYIEDQKITDTIGHCPANRFYEVTGSKVLLLYDIQAKNTLSRAGYWDDAFCVSSVLDYKKKLENWQELREKQIEMFGQRDFRTELNRDFLAAL
jgi:hypothetical protein